MAIDDVSVTIAVGDTKIKAAGFGVPLVLPEDTHTVFTDRTKSYADIDAVAVDFAVTTKTYKAANALFGQTTKNGKSIDTIKVGRVEAGDADVTATLTEIVKKDNDWYALLYESKTKADILLAAAYIETKSKIYIMSVEDADILTSATTDTMSSLQSSTYKRSGMLWHHQGGVDVTGVSITVATLVATVTQAAHGLLVNDPVTVSGADGSDLNGNKLVATVPTDGTFTYATTESDGADSNNGSIDYFAKYIFSDGAWYGSTLPEDPGTLTWKFQTLSGPAATPTSIMDSSERALAEGKNANVYIENAGVSHTREGIMASGRFIDVMRGVDWLDARMEEAVFAELINLQKIPYTNAGLTIIESAMRSVLNNALQATVINPISDQTPYTIVIPDVSSITTADRQNRLFPDITFSALVGNAVHGVQIQGTLQV
jgi:uncharacterized protein DUF3383